MEVFGVTYAAARWMREFRGVDGLVAKNEHSCC